MVSKRNIVSEPAHPEMKHSGFVSRLLHLLLSLVVAAGVLYVAAFGSYRPYWFPYPRLGK